MTIINLSIPFDKKDELKPLKIKWNNEEKTWYFDGDVLPKELDPYVSKYVDIRYDDKDECKAVYKSMTFDSVKKLWKMSMADYKKMTSSHYPVN
jgi:hypothetical protein